MSQITEKQFVDFAGIGAIRSATITRADGRFTLAVRVTGKQGDQVLTADRGHPRPFASLDRMLRKLDELAPSVTEYRLITRLKAQQLER